MLDDADERLRACPWISSETKEIILKGCEEQRERNAAKYKNFSFNLHVYDEDGGEYPLYTQDYFGEEKKRKERAASLLRIMGGANESNESLDDEYGGGEMDCSFY